MYIEEIKCDLIRNDIVKQLKAIGVKHLPRKTDKIPVEKKIEVYHVLKTSLELLEKEHVQLPQSSIPVEVPVFVIDSCRFIANNLLVEGLFRKAGSTSKQRELRALLDCGNRLELDAEHNVINVANILKLFFRELPEPLIPFKFHETLLRCLLLKEHGIKGILLTCLLLPSNHLNTLAYLMQFLNNVAARSKENKMDVGNLSIIFTPSIMPLNTPKLTLHSGERINHHVQIIKLLIENSNLIGVLPEEICNKLAVTYSPFSTNEKIVLTIKREKKKRSSSLTRMLGGIKKIMTKTSPEDNVVPLTSDSYPHTPHIMSSSKKRKAEPLALSSKKKRDILNLLPQRLSLPRTPYSTDPRVMLSPRVLVTRKRNISSEQDISPIPSKSFLSKVPDCGNHESEELSFDHISRTPNSSTVTVLGSCDSFSLECSLPEEYVRIPKVEYEDIKNRVSQIESRIENELGNLLGVSAGNYEEMNRHLEFIEDKDHVNSIHNAYVKTVEESDKLNNSTTEHITQKLSKNLKIRASSDNCIIRSPSARKIGTIRRRSKDNILPRKEINRHSSWNHCDRSKIREKQNVYLTRSLRRGRPNTICTGLPQPNNLSYNGVNCNNLDINKNAESSTCLNLENVNIFSRKENVNQHSVFPVVCTNVVPSNTRVASEKNEWISAQEFFTKKFPGESCSATGRESIAKIRNQNVGMVLAKANYFDKLSNRCKLSN